MYTHTPMQANALPLPLSYTQRISALTVTGFLPATAVAANVFDLLAYVTVYHKRDIVVSAGGGGGGGLLQWLHPH